MNSKDIVLKNILSRRSIRKYTEKEISNEDILTIIKAGMHAPSAVNKQPWHFIVFKDQNIIEKIIEVHPNAGMLRNAPVAILICGDEELAHAPAYISCDCSAATQNMLLAAHAMEIGAVWIGIYPREHRIATLKEIFRLPRNIVPFSVISLGYPAEKKEMADRYKKERIHFDQW